MDTAATAPTSSEGFNPAPRVYTPEELEERRRQRQQQQQQQHNSNNNNDTDQDNASEPSLPPICDPGDIFDNIRLIRDPEHPFTLEELAVLEEDFVHVSGSVVSVEFRPTIDKCSLALHIGLCIRVQLQRTLPWGAKVDVRVVSGSHQDEEAVNKQLLDKERVAAAMEQPDLMRLVEECLQDPDY